MRKLFAICSILTLALLVIVAIRNTNPKWESYQRKFIKLARQRLEGDMQKAAIGDGVAMRQVYLKEFKRIDRCVTCHMGVEIPGMAGAEQPFAAHPGDYLKTHPVEKFGCTVCHEGQGLATNVDDAHANDIKFWESPMLLGNMLYASCVKCHKDDSVVNTKAYMRGKTLFAENGCQGCHRVNGKGGHLGPDLSDLSRASIYLKHSLKAAAGHAGASTAAHEESKEKWPEFYGNINTEFIYEAVKYPKIQPAQSAMVDFKFSNEDAFALTVYLKGFNKEAQPSDYVISNRDVEEASAERGHGLYRQYCVACHGSAGEGTALPELGGTIGPAVGNQQFLSIADMPMLERLISDSRGGVMPAWGKSGGLSTSEIESLALYLKTMKDEAPSFEEIAEYPGNARYGAIFFEGNCASCHGRRGEYETGLIGPSLRSRELNSLADEKFWYNTLTKGREGTAMPSWSYLKRDTLSDLMAYLKTFGKNVSTIELVKGKMGGADVANGKKSYRGRCSGCHGKNGEGGIGPSLNSPEFQSVADVDFLARTIVKGRAQTAMSSFSYVDAGTLADIIKFVKTWQTKPSKTLSLATINGSEYRGEKIFARMCAQCHGERGQGRVGPAILGKGFLATVPDQFIKEMVMYGRSGTQMQANLFGRQGTVGISESQINDLVSYMRSFQDRPSDLYGVASVDGTGDAGRVKYNKYCSQCHGEAGAGGTGPAIGKKGFMDTVSDGFIQSIVMNGRTGTEMKPFGGDEASGGLVTLSENDVADIIHYLRTISPGNTGTFKQVVGDSGAGEVLFKRHCAQCHGDAGMKGFAPSLTNKLFMGAASDSYLQATMVLGRHNTQMKSMVRGGGGVVEMGPVDINNIVGYLKSLKEKFQ